MVPMPHSSHSADLAPSDFSTFLTVKERPVHADVTDKDQLSEELRIILRSIPGEELERIFKAWLKRVQNINPGDGGQVN
jgi:hypothetical protein